jgi:N-acetyl-anhydromuramyl-L-alanine amidase AmpD
MKTDLRRPRTWAILAVLAMLIVAGMTGCGGGDHRQTPAPTSTATAQPAPQQPDAVMPDGASPRSPAGGDSDLASNLRTETGISAKDRAANDRIAQRLADQAPTLRGPPAKAIAPKCITDYSGHVYSDRAPGVTPTEFILHYTVSHNVKGWADVYAIRDYFARTRAGSAHFLMDFEGHCLKMVPGDKKAWTQGNANSYAYSVEIIAFGDEPASAWKNAPLFKDRILARLVRSVMDAHHLPVRRVDPVGCVFPAGWADHFALECGNNHTDVRKHFPFKVFRRQLAEVRRTHNYPPAR